MTHVSIAEQQLWIAPQIAVISLQETTSGPVENVNESLGGMMSDS